MIARLGGRARRGRGRGGGVAAVRAGSCSRSTTTSCSRAPTRASWRATGWWERPGRHEGRDRAGRPRRLGERHRARPARPPATARAGASGRPRARGCEADGTPLKARARAGREARGLRAHAMPGPRAPVRGHGYCTVLTGSTQFGRALAEPERSRRACATTRRCAARPRRATPPRQGRGRRSRSTPPSTPTRSRSSARAGDRRSTACTGGPAAAVKYPGRTRDHAARRPTMPARPRDRARRAAVAGARARTRWSARWSSRDGERWARAGTRSTAARTPSAPRSRLRRRRPPRRDAVRLARAVLPPRPTPPCTDAILEAGIARVVVASDDPTEKASGRGLGILRDEGVEVVVADGELAARARLPQPGLPQARAHRPPAGALQVGDDARRQGRHAHRRLEVDLRRGARAAAPTAGAPSATRSWSGSAPRWPTIRS